MRHLIDIRDFSKEEINDLLEVAEQIIADPVAFQDRCAHKRLATLFFEPSTRTRLSTWLVGSFWCKRTRCTGK